LETEYHGFDVEGILVGPKADFAYWTYDNLSEGTKEEFSRARCENYDGDCDDGRYLHDLGRSAPRHSTGMWPPLSLGLASYDGISDEDLTEAAQKIVNLNLNPGVEKLLNFVIKESSGKVNLITSSYPAIALTVADKFGIPFNQVFTCGYQPQRGRAPKKTVLEEVKERSPISHLSEDRENLGKFLHDYFEVSEQLAKCFKAPTSVDNEILIRTLLERHNELFEAYGNTPNQRNALKRMFLTEEGVMGSHRKVDAMRSVCDDRSAWSYIDDGIVGGMPIDFSDKGISMNMTNTHALPFSKLNVATEDLSQLIPIYDAMMNGDPMSGFKNRFDSEKIRVFTPRDIQQDIDAVVKANSEIKKKLKELYVPVKV